MICNHCGSDQVVKSGRDRRDRQRIRCKVCGHSSYASPVVVTGHGCHHCGSSNTFKSGRDRRDRQRWKCRDCGRLTSEGADPNNRAGSGRPRKWASNAERMRVARARQRKTRIISATQVLDEIPPKDQSSPAE